MPNATLVVPPVYEVQLFGQGFMAAQISARKVKLLPANPDVQPQSRFYNKFDAVEQMTFPQLVQFVLKG